MNKNYYQLLQYYRKCVRKFNRLSATNSQPKKRNFLRKRIEKSLQALQSFQLRFRRKVAIAATAGILAVSVKSAFGQTSFGPPQLSPFGLGQPDVQAGQPRFLDLDGDGDLDMLNPNYSRELDFYENIGTATAPAFAAAVSNPFGLVVPNRNSHIFFYPADLDNDGDLDLMMNNSVTWGAHQLEFIENTGTATSPAFSAPQLDPFGIGTFPERINPVMMDIDNDGDLDLMGANRDNLGWSFYENIGSASSPAFDSLQSNPFGLVPLPAGINSYDPVADFADLDGDGDFDLLAGEFYGDFFYYENTGSNTAPAFAAPVTNPFGLLNVSYTSTVSFGDLDGDGDLDLLSRAEYNLVSPDGFRYFENTDISTSRFEGFASTEFSLYPNPTQGILHLQVEQRGDFALLNTLGQEIRTFSVVPGNNLLEINNLPDGIYLLKDLLSGQAVKFVKE